MKQKIILALICLLPAMGHSYEKSDLILRFGAITVAPDEDSSDIRLNGTAIPDTGISVNNDTQPGISMSYMFGSNIGLGIVAAPPFEHEIYAEGLGFEVGTAKHLPATITGQYFFNTNGVIQPYIGLGINYTAFFGEDEDSELEAALGGAEDLSFDDSVGLVVELGLDVPITEKLLLNVTVWRIDIETTGSVETGAGTVEVDVDVDPWVYMAGIGYKF